jgi:large subunit ribosomal protein L31e
MVKEDKQELAKTEDTEEDLPDVADDEAVTEEPTEAAPEETEEVAAEEQPAEEKAKPKKKSKEEAEIVEERTYTIPLQRALVRPPKKRAPRAMQLIKAFITKHMKLAVTVSEEEEEEELPQLVISKEVNEKIWDKGIEKPPRKIRVRAAKDKDGNVTVYLAETQK